MLNNKTLKKLFFIILIYLAISQMLGILISVLYYFVGALVLQYNRKLPEKTNNKYTDILEIAYWTTWSPLIIYQSNRYKD